MIIKPFSHPSEVFKMLANIESEIKPHLYSDVTELNLLPFVERPKTPEQVITPKPKKGIAGWYNFTVETLKELRP